MSGDCGERGSSMLGIVITLSRPRRHGVAWRTCAHVGSAVQTRATWARPPREIATNLRDKNVARACAGLDLGGRRHPKSRCRMNNEVRKEMNVLLSRPARAPLILHCTLSEPWSPIS